MCSPCFSTRVNDGILHNIQYPCASVISNGSRVMHHAPLILHPFGVNCIGLFIQRHYTTCWWNQQYFWPLKNQFYASQTFAQVFRLNWSEMEVKVFYDELSGEKKRRYERWKWHPLGNVRVELIFRNMRVSKTWQKRVQMLVKVKFSHLTLS